MNWLIDNWLSMLSLVVAIVSAVFAIKAAGAAKVSARAQDRLAVLESERRSEELASRQKADVRYAGVERSVYGGASIRVKNWGGGDALNLRHDPNGARPRGFPAEGRPLAPNASFTLEYPSLNGPVTTAKILWNNPDGTQGELDLTSHV